MVMLGLVHGYQVAEKVFLYFVAGILSVIEGLGEKMIFLYFFLFHVIIIIFLICLKMLKFGNSSDDWLNQRE